MLNVDFFTGQPAELTDIDDPDWVPSLHMGYIIDSENGTAKPVKIPRIGGKVLYENSLEDSEKMVNIITLVLIIHINIMFYYKIYSPEANLEFCGTEESILCQFSSPTTTEQVQEVDKKIVRKNFIAGNFIAHDF